MLPATLFAQLDILRDYSLWTILVLVLDAVAIVSLLMGRASVMHRVIWIIVILLFPCFGVALYFLFGRSPQDA